MTCEKCGTTAGVEEVIDPYIRDVCDREVWVELCDECLSDRAADI